MWAADLAGRQRPSPRMSVVKKLEQLVVDGHVSRASEQVWKAVAKDRNELFHAAMWHFDAVTDEHVAAALKVARDADSVARSLGRKVKKMNNNPG